METEQIGYASIMDNRYDLKHGSYLIENVTWDQRRILNRLFPEGLPVSDHELAKDWFDLTRFPHLLFEYPEFIIGSATHALTFDPMFKNESWPKYNKMSFLTLIEVLASKYFPNSYKGQ